MGRLLVEGWGFQTVGPVCEDTLLHVAAWLADLSMMIRRLTTSISQETPTVDPLPRKHLPFRWTAVSSSNRRPPLDKVSIAISRPIF